MARRTPAVIEFLQYAPLAPGTQSVTVEPTSYSPSGGAAGPFLPLAAPVPAGSTTPIDVSQPVLLAPATQYHASEPAFVRLIDGDQNTDPTVAETVVVTIKDDKTGDSEVLQLTETGPNTGVFVGYIQTSSQPVQSDNGVLNAINDSRVMASYVDKGDATDVHATSALVDPFGVVFNSATGMPVDGVTVTLVDASTSGPAVVYGDDGVSTFPATVTAGGTALDSGGRVYTFSPGGYRFPFISPGNYRLIVNSSDGYRVPSIISTTDLQALPGGTFAIIDPGSRGEDFLVNAGPAIHMDIPVDPISSRLYLIKTAIKTTAAVGDFVPYLLTVENIDTLGLVPGVTVTDKLPVGFRYRKGSARLNQAPAPEPSISGDGRSLTFSVGDLAAAGKADISYVAEVGAGAVPGKAVNTAVAAGSLGVVSNSARATVLVTEDLFMSKTTIVGRVLEGCGDAGRGIEGVRIYLEDGSYVVTDKNGMYHFAAVNPGTHVVQLDTVSLSEQYEIRLCEDDTRFAGTAFSQFVDLQGGSLWRADFHLILKPKAAGEVGLEFRTSLVSTQTGSINKADAQPAASLVTDQMWTSGALCFGELLLKNSPAQTGTARSGVNGHSDHAVMVPFVNEHCCVPDANGQYTVAYAANLHTGAVPVRNLRLIVMMPDGATYAAGSSYLNDGRIPDPDFSDGVLTYRLGERHAGWEGSVLFLATTPAQGAEGKLSTKAFLVFDTPAAKGAKTPVADTNLVRYTLKRQMSEPDAVLHPKFDLLTADLSKSDRKEIEKIIEQLKLKSKNIEHITVTGHTDAKVIRPGASKEFSDNYALSRGRASTVAKIIAAALRIGPDQITIVGKGPDEPIATNKTAEGRQRNRRVELRVDTRQASAWAYIRNEKENSSMKTVPTIGLRPGEVWAREQSEDRQNNGSGKTMPDYDAAWLETAAPGLAWVWPSEAYHPPIPSAKIAIKHDPNKPLKLFLNGVEVEALYLDGRVKRQDNTVAVSTWRGISLGDGDNLFEAVTYDQNGSELERLKRVMHYSTSPVKAEFIPAKSLLSADGKTPPAFAVRLTDKDGHPAREGVIGEYSVDPPFLPRKRVENLNQAPLTESTTDRLHYIVGEDGVALIELEPTTSSGEAVVRINFVNGSQELRAWLKPEMRDWVLVGLAEGTVGYNTLKGNMETAGAAGEDDRYYENGRVAFYAKGMIKGEWLLTAAFDSAKGSGGQPGLYQTVDPNKYYMLYGDGTEQRFDAASAKKIYVKLERDQFYALFGDYETGLTVTELSRYSRNFTGLKSEMKGKTFEYSAFLSENSQAYRRDEIQGDGTSGLYHLSKKNIVLNSETVTIETRDRFRSEVIILRQRLTRFLDYSIDYDAGTIWFKSPVYSRDGNFNPVFIIAEYESADSSEMAYTYGGRGAVKLLGDRVVMGATYVHEGRTGGAGDLEGVDATMDLGNGTKLKAEAATTRTEQTGTKADGSAYLAEVQHHSDTADGKVYVREQGNGFGLGQQNGAETGTRKTGGDVSYRIGKLWTLGGEAFRQENLATGARTDLAELRGRYVGTRYDMLAGVRQAEDTLGTGGTQQSDQIFAGMQYRMTDRLSVRLQHDQSFGSNASINYPTRMTLGADYKLNDTATLFAAREYTYGDQADTTTSRVGMKASPWTGGQIGSTVEQQETENGMRLFSTTGLKQTWQLNKQWSIDGGLDRATTLRRTGNNVNTVNLNVPPASGSTEDFTAESLGVGYRQARWSWTARVESRKSDSEDKFSTFMGANGDVREGLALAAGLQTFRTESATGLDKFNGDLRLSLAYRPAVTRSIVLDRLDLLKDEQHGSGQIDYKNWRIVNNFVMNYKTEYRTQVSLQYGAKYVQETIDQNDYHGYTDLTGLEGRYDITKRWDVGLRGQRLHSYQIDQTQYGAGVSTGFNAGKNVWISLGYNFAGFTDRDFSKADFTSEGPFVKLRMKFDQVSVRDAVKWFSGQ
jgi:uncharacterized repeat protein (TIGR01451 family)